MLSRIAESLFWIGRYVERADDTGTLEAVGLVARESLVPRDPGPDLEQAGQQQ